MRKWSNSSGDANDGDVGSRRSETRRKARRVERAPRETAYERSERDTWLRERRATYEREMHASAKGSCVSIGDTHEAKSARPDASRRGEKESGESE